MCLAPKPSVSIALPKRTHMPCSACLLLNRMCEGALNTICTPSVDVLSSRQYERRLFPPPPYPLGRNSYCAVLHTIQKLRRHWLPGDNLVGAESLNNESRGFIISHRFQPSRNLNATRADGGIRRLPQEFLRSKEGILHKPTPRH